MTYVELFLRDHSDTNFIKLRQAVYFLPVVGHTLVYQSKVYRVLHIEHHFEKEIDPPRIVILAKQPPQPSQPS